MRIDDDTPAGNQLPDEYPRGAPVNLLAGDAELRPANVYAFEGIDGSGKSTLAKATSRWCESIGLRSEILRLGRSDVTNHALERAKWINADPLTLNLINWTSIVMNAIAHRALYDDSNARVFFDRYTLTVKVRGLLEGLPPHYMDLLETMVPRPRRIFFVDASPERCLERILASEREITYFEAGYRDVPGIGEPMMEPSPAVRRSSTGRERLLLRHLEFMRAAYHRLADRYDNLVVIDNSEDSDGAMRIIQRELVL